MSIKAFDGGDGSPPEPDWSQIFTDPVEQTFAAEQWGAAIREMRDRGILSVANGHAIKRLVEFRAQYERAAKRLAEDGSILKAKRTGVPQINPHWTIMRQADEAVARAEAELGLAPVRRQKAAKVERKAKQARAADAYLKAANSG